MRSIHFRTKNLTGKTCKIFCTGDLIEKVFEIK